MEMLLKSNCIEFYLRGDLTLRMNAQHVSKFLKTTVLASILR